MQNTIFLGPFLGLFMDNAEVREAAEKAQSQDLSFKAAVKLAEVSLSLEMVVSATQGNRPKTCAP